MLSIPVVIDLGIRYFDARRAAKLEDAMPVSFRQRFLCLIFCFVVVVFLLFVQKHIICHTILQCFLQG